MLPEGTLAELIDGILYMSPSPIDSHQRAVTRLVGQMYLFVEKNDLGEIFTAPFDVYLDEHSNAVQPDILFLFSALQHPRNFSVQFGTVRFVNRPF
jgi:Uma2 family endonuclease